MRSAQEHWLRIRNIPRIPGWPAQEQYRAYKAREELRGRLVGTSGQMIDGRRADIQGTRIATTTDQGRSRQAATVTDVDFAPHMNPQRGAAIYLAVWGTEEFRAEVRLGPFTSTVPALGGLAVQEAVNRAWQAGFVCDIEYVDDPRGYPDNVRSTRPPAGTELQTNSAQSGELTHIVLVVTRRPEG